jgi:hypothetical protein
LVLVVEEEYEEEWSLFRCVVAKDCAVGVTVGIFFGGDRVAT